MNKFLTILLPPLLVVAFHGLGLCGMSEETPSAESTPSVTQTSSGLPVGLEYSRFLALGKKSPFTLASSTGELADFAKDLYLAGFARMAGEEYVVVANKSKPDRVLVGKKPSPAAQGMVLVEIRKDPSGDAAKMEARIKKGDEVATLKYEVFGSGEAPGVPPVVAGQPGAPAPLPPNATGVPTQPGQTTPSQATAGSGPKLPASLTRSRRTPVLPPKLGR